MTGVTTALDEQWRTEQLAACQWLREHTPYRPNRYAFAVQNQDGPQSVAFARRMLLAAEPSGFERLRELGELWWSLEAAVLRTRWLELFTDAERDVARWRLLGAGVTDPDAFANASRFDRRRVRLVIEAEVSLDGVDAAGPVPRAWGISDEVDRAAQAAVAGLGGWSHVRVTDFRMTDP